MILRKATKSDLPALLAIYNHEVRHSVSTLDLQDKTIEEWEIWFDHHQSELHPLIVAEEEGVIAGYASLSKYREKEAYIATAELSVYVAAESRRKGVAKALMAEILSLGRQNPQLHTIVSVITAGNEASRKLHEQFGFVYSGCIKEVGQKFGNFLDIENYYPKVK